MVMHQTSELWFEVMLHELSLGHKDRRAGATG